jgi:hypothetical protein
MFYLLLFNHIIIVFLGEMFMKKAISLFLTLILVFSICAPMTAHAQTPALRIFTGNSRNTENVMVEWDDNLVPYYSVRFEISYDNVNWQFLENNDNTGSVSINTPAKTAAYYRYIPYTEHICYDEDGTIDEQYTEYGEPSPSLFIPTYAPTFHFGPMSSQHLKTYANIEWYARKGSDEYIDGFYVFCSVNGGEYKLIRDVPFSEYKSVEKDGSRNYSIKHNDPSNVTAFYARYMICGYYKYNGQVYYFLDETETPFAYYYAGSGFFRMTTKKNGVQLNWENLGSDFVYKLTYARYNLKTNKFSKEKEITIKDCSYFLKTDTKKYGYWVYLEPYRGKENMEYAFPPLQDSNYGTAHLRNAKLVKNNRIKVINARKKKSKTKTVKLSKNDKSILKKYCEKEFKGVYLDEASRAEETNHWIFQNVKYSKSKVKSKSDVEAVFSKKRANPEQANRAFAALLSYLGYDVRLIEGKLKTGANHCWIEIKCGDEWRMCDTGFYQNKNSKYQSFFYPYKKSKGYMKNGKVIGK